MKIDEAIEMLIFQYKEKEDICGQRLMNLRIETGVARRNGKPEEIKFNLIKERVGVSAQKVSIQQFIADLDSLLDNLPFEGK